MAPTAGMRLRFKTVHSKKPLQTPKKVPSLKNRIRGLERFLNRGGLSDATRRAKKAELEQLKDEHEIKDHVTREKKLAEKYRRPRFFERVKLMRKLRQASNRMQQATDEAERAEQEKKLKTYREDMMYIYYYPKSEPYIPLFLSASHSEENQKRQKQLRKEAVSRFEKEQPLEAFRQFCFSDGKSKESGAAGKTRSAAELLLKNPTKEMVKKQEKKALSKRGKPGNKTKPMPVLVDQEDDGEIPDAAKEDCVEEEEHEERGEKEGGDDFFL